MKFMLLLLCRASILCTNIINFSSFKDARASQKHMRGSLTAANHFYVIYIFFQFRHCYYVITLDTLVYINTSLNKYLFLMIVKLFNISCIVMRVI